MKTINKQKVIKIKNKKKKAKRISHNGGNSN